jgi:hypothetical protein
MLKSPISTTLPERIKLMNGPTIENLNIIHDKAKVKKDGVYSFRGMLYRVKDHRFTHFTNYQEILQRMGNFNVSLGFTVHPRKALEKMK